MKKTIMKFLCSMISLVICLSGINVFAETPMQIKWYGDYGNSDKPELVVEFTTPVLYNQRVMMTVYPDSVTNPSSTDYVRVKEIATGRGKTEAITINITNAFNATNGAYKVELNGNGYQENASKDIATVYVIKPSDIPAILGEFKTATATNFETVLNKVMPALQLEAEADSARKADRMGIMLNTQRDDLGGEFPDLNAVRDAWNVSDVIAYINDSTATASGAKSRIDKVSTELGLNKSDSDYIAHINAVCTSILAYKGEYDNNSGVRSTGDLKGIINQHMGVKAVNASDRDGIYNVFEKYKEYFELPSDSLEKYNGFTVQNRDKVMRWLYDKNFVKNSDLEIAFTNGVNEVEASLNGITPPSVVVPQGGGNSGGSSFSGSGISQPTPPADTTSARFSDVTASHWAYPYVAKLSENGTIGGYDDGTFKPDNKVTREEFVKMIIGASGLLDDGAVCDFSDVSEDAWYYEYIASGYSKGIIGGMDDNTFGVGRQITRQDVAVIAARILTRLSDSLPQTGDATLTDIDTVSDYALEAVTLLNGMGIINGFDDGSFRPHDALTRAEAATIISKLIERL